MANRIIGKEYSLHEIFGEEFEYHIPVYQRPYSWTKKETEELFDDLHEAFSDENNEAYFLGSIVLVKEENKPRAEVIDGQQRLTTLTMLIAVISTYLPDSLKSTWNQYLIETGNQFINLTAKPRIQLRDRDQRFFNKYIQNIDLDGLDEQDEEMLPNESQKNIKINCRLLRDKVEQEFLGDQQKVFEFGSFLIGQCYMIAVSTPTEQSAFRVFSILNDRGMNLLPTDIIKSTVIGMIPDDNKKEFTDKWEEMEIQTSRQGFYDVILHTRMIFAKTKAKANILDEFKEHVLSRFSSEDLIDNVLCPFSEAYSTIINRNYSARRNAEAVNSYFFWLNKIDNSDWMPTAIKFLADKKQDSDYVLWFVKKFERLVACLYITSSDRRQRIERYAKILEEMEGNPAHCLNDPLLTVELTDEEKRDFIKSLDGEIYKMTPLRRNYVILRLNSFLGDGAYPVDSGTNTLTIEHVLPQTIKPETEWERNWPNIDIRDTWLNRIANLVSLTRRSNSAAKNADFGKKKKIYFSYKGGSSTSPLTNEVIMEMTWTPEVLERRQKKLIQKFTESWELDYKKPDKSILHNQGEAEDAHDNEHEKQNNNVKDKHDLKDIASTNSDNIKPITRTMNQEIFIRLQANGRGKKEICKELFEEWGIAHDKSLDYAKYGQGSRYYWMEPSKDVLTDDWTCVLFNIDALKITVLRIPKDSLSVNSGKGFKMRNDASKKGKLKLEFLEDSFIDKPSKVNFSKFITNIIDVKIV